MTGTTPLLEVIDVAAQPAPAAPAVTREVSFRVHAGQSVGLVGESGAGKTTVLRAIVGLAPIAEGRILGEGVDIFASGHRALVHWRRTAQMVFQDAGGSLDRRFTVAQAVAEGVELHRIGAPGQRLANVVDALKAVGLGAELLDHPVRRLSGGQRQRVALARALAVEPKLLLADEPVSALDAPLQAQILNLLRDLRTDRSIALVVVTHDLRVVEYLCDFALVMRGGIVVEQGAVDEMLDAPQHPYTQRLLESARRLQGAPRSAHALGEA